MLAMEPLTIAGSVVGTYINALLPPWLLCVLLVLLLGATTLKTGSKGVKMYKKETASRESCLMKKSQKESTPLLIEGTKQNTNQSYYQTISEAATGKRLNVSAAEWVHPEPELEQLREGESTHSIRKMSVILLCTVGTSLITVFKGGHGINPLDVTCGSAVWWTISLLTLPFVILISIFARRHLVKVYHLKKRLDWVYLKSDVQWNERNTIMYPLTCSVAGLCAGLFGIGGGIVKGPLMLEMGVLPEVASATSATMILFTSFAATACYVLFGSLNMEYVAVLFPIGLVFTLFGQLLLNAIVKRYNRSSLIVLCIATIIFLSTIAMGIESSGGVIDLIKGRPTPHRSFCE